MFLTSLFNLKGLLISAGVAALLAGSGSWYVTHKMDLADYRALELKQEQAVNKAWSDAAADQKKRDDKSQKDAVAFAVQQQIEADAAHQVTKEIIRHVSDTVPCITYGLVRVLNDAASGLSAADASHPAGQSDDTCAPVAWRAFAADIADDYHNARLNADQLNALIADVQGQNDLTTPQH